MKVAKEMRAVIPNAEVDTNPFAQFDIARAGVDPPGVDPSSDDVAHSTYGCRLGQISIYVDRFGNPGLRLDYKKCFQGPAKRMTMLLGLRKAPINARTLGLGRFFQGVCGNQTSFANFQLNSEALLDPSGRLLVRSAEFQHFTSDKHCFDDTAVVTLFDHENNFNIFDVAEDEFEWIVSQVPRLKRPQSEVHVDEDVISKDPCEPVKPGYKDTFPVIYGSQTIDRLCVQMPELPGEQDCGKFCVPSTPLSTHTPAPPAECIQCFDCHIEATIYAFICTILAFYLNNWVYKNHVYLFPEAWRENKTDTFFASGCAEGRVRPGAGPCREPSHSKSAAGSVPELLSLCIFSLWCDIFAGCYFCIRLRPLSRLYYTSRDSEEGYVSKDFLMGVFCKSEADRYGWQSHYQRKILSLWVHGCHFL
jgi:hypothetical protein